MSVCSIEENPDEVAMVFSMLKIVPFHIVYEFKSDVFEYHAMCDQFDAVDLGFITPEYDLIITKSKDGKITSAEFKKKENITT